MAVRRRVAAIARFALPLVAVVWGMLTLLFSGAIVTLGVMFAFAAERGRAGNPISAIDGTLGSVARDSGVVAPVFETVPALLTLVHALAVVLAMAVVVRARVGVVARVTGAAVLIIVASSAVRFWETVVRAPGAPVAGPDVVAWTTLFLLPTLVVLTLELAVRAPHRTHRRTPEPVITERHRGRHV